MWRAERHIAYLVVYRSAASDAAASCRPPESFTTLSPEAEEIIANRDALYEVQADKMKANIEEKDCQHYNIFFIRHGVSNANIQQEMSSLSSMAGRKATLHRTITRDPGLHLPTTMLNSIYIHEKIRNHIMKLNRHKPVSIAVSELKRTWMTAVVVAYVCRFSEIKLYPYKALNETGMGMDNTKDTHIECAKSKTHAFASRFGVKVHFEDTNINFRGTEWTRDLMNDMIQKNISVAVSHGQILRHQEGSLKDLDTEFKGIMSKLMGNYAVVGYNQSTHKFDLLDRGIPKDKYETMRQKEYLTEPPCEKIDNKFKAPNNYEQRFANCVPAPASSRT